MEQVAVAVDAALVWAPESGVAFRCQAVPD
jgi:hypothetical protein